jgi:peptidoglycan hydrolase-like protein with peptidoglycan-binding domain
MKKSFAVILIILVNSIFALSQIETPTKADWQIFTPAIEEFSVEVPSPFILGGDSEVDANLNYSKLFDGTYFFIFSEKPKNTFLYERAMGFVKSLRQIGSLENIGEYETEKFEFADSENFYHTILTAKSENRVYVFQTTSPIKDNPAVTHFFSSLKLKGKTSMEVLTSPKVETIAPIPNQRKNIETKKPESNQISLGNSNGTGKGNGIESGRGDSSGNSTETKPLPSPTPNNQTFGVKILTKPRANYTDFARFYNISGKVVLRVTFSANGTIGSITPITKLPFGLTNEAITAVKGITFEPAKRDGVAYSVTKPVEYSFTIY